MGVSSLRLVRVCTEFCPKSEIANIPNHRRGIYALCKEVAKKGKRAYNVVYIGMSCSGVRGRLAAHNRGRKQALWTHFSIYDVWPNITDDEIVELEGLFRAIYRRDTKANSLAKQKSFKRLKNTREDDFSRWPLP